MSKNWILFSIAFVLFCGLNIFFINVTSNLNMNDTTMVDNSSYICKSVLNSEQNELMVKKRNDLQKGIYSCKVVRLNE